jgi:hypothetical protein
MKRAPTLTLLDRQLGEAVSDFERKQEQLREQLKKVHAGGS